MTIPRPADGHGSSLSFSGLTANIIQITAPSIKRAAIPATHLGSVDTEDFIPAKLVNAGQVTIEVEFDPATVYPIQGAEAALAIAWASTVPATWTWPGAIMTDAKLPTAKTGDKLVASLTFQLRGMPVVS